MGDPEAGRVERDSGSRKPIMRVWDFSTQRGPGVQPLLRGSKGRIPLKLKAF